jgi:aspartokinase/homoserine dehydrogenase 1
MKVLKFGGSSVASAENIEKVIEIVRRASEEDSCVVVLSAMQGATDALIETGKLAENGDENFRLKIREIENKHVEAVRQLLPPDAQNELLSFIQKSLGEIESICEGVFLLRELSPRSLDRISGFGELLSTRIVSAKLGSMQIENVWKDSRELVRTDSNFNFAAVDFAKTNEQIQEFFQNSNARLHILPGFIASDANEITTTLGRGGSDYTAAILAAALDAGVLEIWTE